jgi:organic radical activating enzyme
MCKALRGELPADQQVCLVDATGRCNTTCPQCYYDFSRKVRDPSVAELVSEAEVLQRHYAVQRVLFTGGEPTVRDDLPEILAKTAEIGSSAEFATNGIRLADLDYFKEVLRGVSTRPTGEKAIYFSLHLKAGREKDWEAKHVALENLRAQGVKILCLMFSVENEEQTVEAIEESRKHWDIATQIRLRGVAPHWRTKGGPENTGTQVFASEVYGWVLAHAHDCGAQVDIRYPADTSHCRFNMYFDQKSFRLIHWPTEHNIDLEEHVFGPYYRSRLGGRICHFIHTLLLNQGKDLGYQNGQPVPVG